MNRIEKLLFKFIRKPKVRANYLKKKGIIDLGEGCEVFPNVVFGSEPYLIKIGNQVRLTSGVKFITHDGGLWVIRNMGLQKNADKMGMITVGNNVFIGWDTIIMPNVTIGDNVIIGAGSIVTKNIPDNTIAVGVPAKPINTIEGYFEKNKMSFDDTKHLSRHDKKEYYIRKYNL